MNSIFSILIFWIQNWKHREVNWVKKRTASEMLTVVNFYCLIILYLKERHFLIFFLIYFCTPFYGDCLKLIFLLSMIYSFENKFLLFSSLSCSYVFLTNTSVSGICCDLSYLIFVFLNPRVNKISPRKIGVC